LGLVPPSPRAASARARSIHRLQLALTIHVERHDTEVRDETGRAVEVDLWTGCYTPRELRLLFRVCGLEVQSVASVEPGVYGDRAPTIEEPEFLVVGIRPSHSAA
jgi:hypothetical protein